MASVGSNIKRLRSRRKLTQEQLAEQLFVTRQAVSAWETGKALPDIEALERIAEALGCTVMEIIYGTVPPEVRRQRKQWLVTGFLLAAMAAALIFGLYRYGVIGTLRDGLRYQYFNLNYDVELEELPMYYSMEIDLTDPESNIGKVLYEDNAGCRIILSDIRPASGIGEYSLSFNAEGVYSPLGGQLVTGCYERRAEEKGHYSLRLSAAMYTSVDGIRLSDSHYYTQSSIDKNGNFFGFHLFPIDFEGDIPDTVTITVRGLTKITTSYRGSRFG